MNHLSLVAPPASDDLECSVDQIGWHRNGSCGEPFFVVTFTCEGERFVATCFFDQDVQGQEQLANYENPRVAVLALADVASGEHVGSYRGDYFADQLLEACQAWSDARAAR